MKKIAKLVSLMTALALLLSCGIAMAEVTYPIDTDVTLTMWRVLDGSIADAGYTTSNDTPAVLKWEADTGVNLEIKEFADDTALVLAMQADELPDMILINYPKYNGGVMGMVNDGIITEVTEDMVAQNAPDYWNYINSFDLYKQYITELDGKMYSFAPHLFEPGSIYRFWKGFIFRKDILDANGLELPTTNAQFKELLVSLKNNVNGIVVPWTFNKDEFPYVFNNGYITSEYGLPNCAEYQDDGVYHYGAYEPAYKDVLSFVNELYAEGLISPDFATMDEATAQSMFLQGESAVLFGNNSRLNTLLKAATDGTVLIGGEVFHGADQEKALYSYADPYVTTGDGIYFSTTSPNVELGLQFLNYLYTEQGNLLRNFGTEGESYTMVDGIPTYTEFITNNPDGYSLDAVARSWALINWPGIHADEMNRQRHPELSQIDAYQKWSNTLVDEYMLTYTGVLDEYLDEYTDIWTDIDTYIKECRVKFISGQMSVENDFDGYIATLQSMGMDRAIEIKQLTLDAYNAR